VEKRWNWCLTWSINDVHLYFRKENEIKTLNGKVEEMEGIIAQLQRKNKDLQARIEELEEELEAEKQARMKVN